jgi:F-type H+-transporting ATPase subunit b
MILDFLIPVAHAAEEVVHETASPVGVLGLNLKLFIGQIINFGILLFVFWKLILPNITKGLQSRQEKIAKSLQDADDVAKEKEEFTKWRNEEMVKARHEAAAIVTKAQTDATTTKDEILHKAKVEQEKIVEDAKKRIESEKNQQLQSAKAELADLVTNAAEKILRQKLDGKKDAELIKESLKSL